MILNKLHLLHSFFSRSYELAEVVGQGRSALCNSSSHDSNFCHIMNLKIALGVCKDNYFLHVSSINSYSKNFLASFSLYIQGLTIIPLVSITPHLFDLKSLKTDLPYLLNIVDTLCLFIDIFFLFFS